MGASGFQQSLGVGKALGRSRKEVSEQELPAALSSPGLKSRTVSAAGAEQGRSQKASHEYEC